MMDTTFIPKLFIRELLADLKKAAMVIMIVLLLGYGAHEVQEMDWSSWPDCTTEQTSDELPDRPSDQAPGQLSDMLPDPGLVVVAQPVTSDSVPICFPNPIVGEEFKVIPPR